MRLKAACIMLVLLSGCIKVGPNFRAPHAPCKERWMEQGDARVELTDDVIGSWWESFNDPILDDLTQLAREQNLTLEVACYRIQEARARLGIAIGEFFPQIQEGFGAAERVRLSRNMPNPPPVIDFQDFQLGGQVFWEIDLWGKYRRAIESEKAGYFASYANYNDVLVLLMADVAATYVQIRTFEELFDVVFQNIRIQERSLQISQAQFEAGFVSELDVQQATSLLRDTEARLPQIEAAVQQSKNALCVLLGISAQEISCLLGDSRQIPIAPEEVVATMPETLLYRRPDIRRALFDAWQQCARIGVAAAEFFPQVSLDGLIGLDSNKQFLTRDSLTFGYGSSFIWPLLNYGRITNRVKVEQSLFCQLATLYKDQVLRAYQEVEDGLIGFVKAQEQEELLNESVAAAMRAVELSRAQYVEGLTDFTTVLNTLESLLSEEEQLIQARSSIALNLITTYKALGGGWETH